MLTLSLLLSLLCGSRLLAHEGKVHVMGTIASVEADRLVVTDRDGKTISMALTERTAYSQGDTPVTVKVLTVGARVVVDVTGPEQSLTATEVRVAPPVQAPRSGEQPVRRK